MNDKKSYNIHPLSYLNATTHNDIFLHPSSSNIGGTHEHTITPSNASNSSLSNANGDMTNKGMITSDGNPNANTSNTHNKEKNSASLDSSGDSPTTSTSSFTDISSMIDNSDLNNLNHLSNYNYSNLIDIPASSCSSSSSSFNAASATTNQVNNTTTDNNNEHVISVKQEPVDSLYLLPTSDQTVHSNTKRSSSLPTSSSSSNPRQDQQDGPVTCKWNNCNLLFNDAKTLYDHLCDFHVGRKCNRNLSLNCQWDKCQVITVKRDHITSHIRVHIPLKPYSCSRCTKKFKRPQDLKKHSKVHNENDLHNFHNHLLNPQYHYGQQQQQSFLVANNNTANYVYPKLPDLSYNYATSHPQQQQQQQQQQLQLQLQQQQQHQQLQQQGYSLPPLDQQRKRKLDPNANFNLNPQSISNFYEDIKRSKIQPTYNQDLINKLNSFDQQNEYPLPPFSQQKPANTTLPYSTSNNGVINGFISQQDILDASSFFNQLSTTMNEKHQHRTVAPVQSTATTLLNGNGMYPTLNAYPPTSAMNNTGNPVPYHGTLGDSSISSMGNLSLHPRMQLNSKLSETEFYSNGYGSSSKKFTVGNNQRSNQVEYLRSLVANMDIHGEDNEGDDEDLFSSSHNENENEDSMSSAAESEEDDESENDNDSLSHHLELINRILLFLDSQLKNAGQEQAQAQTQKQAPLQENGTYKTLYPAILV